MGADSSRNQGITMLSDRLRACLFTSFGSLSLILAGLSLSACKTDSRVSNPGRTTESAQSVPANEPYVEGVATYQRKKVTVPLNDAELMITLMNSPAADAPGYVVAQTRISRPVNPPYYFRIYYPADYLEERRQFKVYADISCAGHRLLESRSGVSAVSATERTAFEANGVDPNDISDEHHVVLELAQDGMPAPCPGRHYPEAWDGGVGR